ncbi:calcium-translocating P-type ATPase, PMCA-type [Zavarzinella formosa]|uniref:calcium-translocating P-type ATPase, PMCA-type n=1 Tax=Zavarzinella formosa TaxID=360055 RepID=UPI0002F2F465|nr:calcium-translocating P-type ATPase, PMCA-type [Zavarzinella formosa]
MRTLRDLIQQFPGLKETGLSSEDAAKSLQQYGANRLTPLPREPMWKKFLGKFDEAIIKILLAATLLKTVVDLFAVSGTFGMIGLALLVITLGLGFALKLTEWLPSMMFAVAIVLVGLSLLTEHPSFEGLAVMIAVMLATGVAFASEYKSDREFEVLNTQKDSLKSKVVRGGQVHTFPLEDVVVGDLVILEMGDEIPADGRIVRATELLIDQSLMTGESEPVKKIVRPDDETAEGPDQPHCVYRGTQVVDGAGQMVITDVGDLTMIGQIARRLSADAGDDEEGDKPETEETRVQRKLTLSKEQTPLQVKLTALAGLISKVGYAAAVAIFLALLVRGLIVGEVAFSGTETMSQAEVVRDTIRNLLSYFVYMVIIIVVAVPEGLPMSVTVSLALAMRKMTRANSLVRQLVACETIGSATVICSDKTGTLTQNKMQVDRLVLGGKNFDRGNDWPKPTAQLNTAADWIALNGTANSTANLEEKEGKTVVIGNSTEGALLQWARESGVEYGRMRSEFPLRYQMHFSSDRKRMTSVAEGSKLVALMKGAPEVVLSHCTHWLDESSKPAELTSEIRERIITQVKEASGLAMRTLAFAHKELPAGTSTDEDALHEGRDQLEKGLTFAGFVAIRDPLRPEVKDAVAQCRQAGIEVKMITGDNIETATAIGREIGLMDDPGSIALTSAEINQLTDDQLKEKLPNMRILARARPLDKFRVVRLLQELEHVVAVTGDGTNDAPALKKADVGLAMGIAGTEVAKEASKIVLLDDSFATIVKAVHWGRALYENIQRFVLFQLTINVSALMIAFLGPFFGIKPPFTVLQLLWINVIMDTFAAIALCSEPPRAGLMKMKPKRRDESIITPAMRLTILLTGGFFVVVMMGVLFGMQHQQWFAEGSGPNPEGWEFAPLNIRQVSLFFTMYVLFQVWNMINCRSLTPESSGLIGFWRNRSFMGIMLAIIIGQVIIVTFGGAIFSLEALKPIEWALLTAATASVLVFAEVVRQLRGKATE